VFSLKFSTKGNTLTLLKTMLTSARVLDLFIIRFVDWLTARDEVLDRIRALGWFDTRLIIRSSSAAEDNCESSMAGHFTSVLDVLGEKDIINAVEKVFASYTEKRVISEKVVVSDNEEILIQPMLANNAMSGVAFSKDISSGSDYIIINYDESGSTDSVTSGGAASLKTYYHFKHYSVAPDGILGKIINLLKELEKIFETDAIDIEFGVDGTGELYLFQVRPLCVKCEPSIDKDLHSHALTDIYNTVVSANKRNPFLYGHKTILGVMPDWNPAEIIGLKPNPLALSVYKNVITDNIWAYQRNNYGYKNLRGFPLLISLKGIPYIDTRVSFNSFLPRDLDGGICEKLVNYYIDELIKHPGKHDKIEFEIVFSCYTFDVENQIQALDEDIFSDEEKREIIKSLKNLTNNIIAFDTGIWKKDIERIEILEQRREKVLSSELGTTQKIYWLLEDCKRYGTLPFAGLARAAFIAVEILKSLISVGIISDEEYNSFMESLNTVSKTMVKDYSDLKLESFIKKYGHLRPGTYDILKPRYDEAMEAYFNADQGGGGQKTGGRFALSLEQYRAIKNLLKERELEYDVLELFEFIKTVIEGREYSKYIFTKSLSDILMLFKELCQRCGFSLEDAAYANIEIINEIYSSAVDVKEIIENSIVCGKQRYAQTKAINLPALIIWPEEVFGFHQMETEPNFVTTKCIRGEITVLDKMNSIGNMKDHIVFISSADPGFDWIFSRGLKGLVTKYGGINSHMAIRAAELSLPAIIGCGEKLYDSLASADMIEIDCLNKKVTVVK